MSDRPRILPSEDDAEQRGMPVRGPVLSQQRLVRLASLNSDFLFACRHKGDAFQEGEWISETFYRITGFSPQELEQAGCWLFCAHPEDRPAVEQAFAALTPGLPETREFRILTREGQTRWVRCTVEIEPGEDGALRRIGAVKDITDQVAVEKALLQNRAELHAVYEQAPVMLSVLNLDRRVLFANRAFVAFTGKSEEEILARRVCASLGCRGPAEGHQCDACPLLHALARTAETGEAFQNLEHRMELRRGETCREVILLGAVCRLDHPSSPKLLLTLQDITELKAAEAARRAAEQQFRAIFEVSPTAILLLKEGRYTFANPAAARLLGFERPDEVVGLAFESTVTPDFQNLVRERMRRNLEGLPNPPLEMQAVRRDGTLVDIESYSVPLHLPEGTVTLVQCQDISERRQAELLQRARAELSEAALSLDLDGLTRRTLELLASLTESRVGFVHEVGPNALRALLAAPQTSDIHEALAEALRRDGSLLLDRILVAAIRRHGALCALVTLADKATPYTARDLRQVEQVANLAWDILEAKRQEEALLEREQRLQRLSEVTEVGIVLHEQGTIFEANDAALRMFRYDAPTEVIGRSLMQFIHPEDLPMALQRSQDLGESVYEIRALRSDGEVFPMRVHSRAMTWNGRSVRVASIEDLSTVQRLEAELELREQRLMALLHNLPGVVFQWRVRAHGTSRLEYLSPRAAELFGLQEDPASAGWELADHIHPEDLPAFRESLAEAIRLRQTWRFEGRFSAPGSAVRWIHLQSYPVADGPDLVFHGLVLDTTERMEALAALVESEARFRTLFDTHNAAFLLVDPADGAIVNANQSALAYYGYTAEEVSRLHINDLNALPSDEVARERRKALRHEQNYFIFPHRMKGGEVRTVEVHSSPVTIGGRDLLFSIIHDITERMVVEDALRQSERRFRLLLDASNDAVFLHGFREDGSADAFLEVSRAACTWLGYDREELLRLTTLELVAPEARANLPGLANRLLQQGSLVFTQTLVNRQGQPIQAELSSQIVEVDRRILVLTIARDISERNRAQALATATESILAKGRMAAYIAHEINSPLAGIKNAFMLVSDAIPPEHRFYRYVGMIHQEIGRISNIVKTMYELYKPTSQVASDLLVETVLQDVATLLAPKVRSHQAELRLELPDPTLRATLPSDLLRQVLFNLLQNALEASPAKGVVCCRASRDQERLCLQVIDEGPGIAPELAARIFEPGFSTKHGLGTQMGLGLGLGSARKLAEGMGGTLTFANHADRRGCTFTLDLPLSHPGIPAEHA